MARQPSRVQMGQLGGINPTARRRVLPRPVLLTPGPALALQHSSDPQLRKAQAASVSAFGQAKANPQANHTVLENVYVGAGGWIIVQHGLGFAFSGAEAFTFSALATYAIAHNAALGFPAELDKSQLLIQVSANTTLTLRVY